MADNPFGPSPFTEQEWNLISGNRLILPSGEPLNNSGTTVGQTWRPMDLRAILAGEHTPPQPTVGIARRDGLRLLYAGKEHAAIGEMESGKSWLAVASAVAELTAGEHVVYVHFEEADPTDTVFRLRALGVPDDTISERFHYVAPNEPVDPAAVSVLVGLGASVVVLDGVNEAMSLHGWKIMEPTGATEYRHHLVKPFTTAGAAALSLDHVTKDPERRGRNALGSIHKGNGLTGSLIVLENVAPFGRDARGCSHMFITKDRPGFLRRNGRPSKLPGKTFIGSLIVDDTREHRGWLDLAFIEPQDRDDEADQDAPASRGDQDDDAVLKVATDLIAGASGQPASLRSIRAKVTGIGWARVSDAVTRLALDGRLIESTGPRNARLFTLPTGAG